MLSKNVVAIVHEVVKLCERHNKGIANYLNQKNVKIFKEDFIRFLS